MKTANELKDLINSDIIDYNSPDYSIGKKQAEKLIDRMEKEGLDCKFTSSYYCGLYCQKILMGLGYNISKSNLSEDGVYIKIPNFDTPTPRKKWWQIWK